MAERKRILESIRNANQSSIPTIQKVPFILKRNKDFHKHFVPSVVSIGPYHHQNEDLKITEKFKLKFAAKFMAGKEEVLMAVYDEILQDIDALRNCYNGKEVTKEILSDEKLAQILFLDGCSVLHYINYYVNRAKNKHWIGDHHAAVVNQDLFLLENQLPFQVLKLLINAKYDTTASSNGNEEKVGMEMIEDFIQQKIGTQGYGTPDLNEEHSHLLDLLLKRLVGSTNQQNTDEKQQDDGERITFRNVSELIAAGIYLKPSDTNSLADVSFTPQLTKGVLKLPRMTVDDSTGPMFLNLIAHEMSPGVETNREVITYICFLESLIDRADDVKQLRAAGILDNLLGSDQKVADLCNEMGTDLVPNKQIYQQVKSGIQKHYSNKKKTAIADFYHTHFSSPLTTIAFVWALITILLTAITSFFTIFPSKDECSGLCKKLINSPHI